MPTLYVRGVPAELYERLRGQAASSRRSLSAEAIELLSKALASERPGVSLQDLLEHADGVRARHALPADSPKAAELIRRDRDR